MVAIIANALAAVPALLAGGLGRARRQPLAHDLARLAAHRATGDRGRDGARHRARAGRGDHARDGRRRRAPFAANPLDGITFLFEPVQPLAATIIQEFGGPDDRPAGAHDLRDRRRAAGLGGAAVVRRLGGQAAAEALRDRAPDGRRARDRLRAGPPEPVDRPAAPREGTSVLAAGRPRSCYWLCWATGIGLCLIAVAIVLFMFVKGVAYLRPSLFVHSPAPSLQPEPGRRLPGPDRGHADRDRDRHRDRGPARRRARGVAVGVRAPGLARARGRVGDRDDRRACRASCSRSSACSIFSQGFLGFLSQQPADGSGHRAVVLRPPGSSWRCSRCR